jgi:hypothetical protein
MRQVLQWETWNLSGGVHHWFKRNDDDDDDDVGIALLIQISGDITK